MGRKLQPMQRNAQVPMSRTELSSVKSESISRGISSKQSVPMAIRARPNIVDTFMVS